MKVISEADVTGKKVLVRADLDVPVEGSHVTDDFRLRATLPTLRYLIDNGVTSITIIGHRGRPRGQTQLELSLEPVKRQLEMLLQSEFKPDGFRKVAVRPNLRFDPREEENDAEFAQELTAGHDLYVNEAFAASHREHASIVGIPQYLPSYAGLRFAEEVARLRQVRDNPARPLVFIIGGGKRDKVEHVKTFSQYADEILLGGVLMFAQELEGVPGVKFPMDAVDVDDIGPKSVELFKGLLDDAKTVVWNGPLGRFEEEQYASGTHAIAELLAAKARVDETDVIVGGGDTIAALNQFHLRDKMSFVSTGGGAMLELLATGSLPGLVALNEN